MQKTKIINQTFKYLVSAVRIFINFAKILGVIPPEHRTNGQKFSTMETLHISEMFWLQFAKNIVSEYVSLKMKDPLE